jgi:plastocyanin
VHGTLIGGRRHLPLVAATGLTITGLVLALAVFASSAMADASVEMTEGSATDINTWGFTPPDVTISAGQSVTWMNSGALAHTATAVGGQFDTGTVGPGESKTITLSSPGSIAYQCTPHPWMKGTLTVLAAAAAAPAPPAAAPAAPAPAAAVPPAAPAKPVAQQQLPTPTPFRFIPSGATTTTTTAPAPRAGGIPIELALPLLAGGASALSGGVYLLRRGRRPED